MTDWKVGDAVVINDGSEAHGDVGEVWGLLDNGFILVELENCLWPVHANEIRRVDTSEVMP